MTKLHPPLGEKPSSAHQIGQPTIPLITRTISSPSQTPIHSLARSTLRRPGPVHSPRSTEKVRGRQRARRRLFQKVLPKNHPGYLAPPDSSALALRHQVSARQGVQRPHQAVPVRSSLESSRVSKPKSAGGLVLATTVATIAAAKPKGPKMQKRKHLPLPPAGYPFNPLISPSQLSRPTRSKDKETDRSDEEEEEERSTILWDGEASMLRRKKERRFLARAFDRLEAGEKERIAARREAEKGEVKGKEREAALVREEEHGGEEEAETDEMGWEEEWEQGEEGEDLTLNDLIEYTKSLSVHHLAGGQSPIEGDGEDRREEEPREEEEVDQDAEEEGDRTIQALVYLDRDRSLHIEPTSEDETTMRLESGTIAVRDEPQDWSEWKETSELTFDYMIREQALAVSGDESLDPIGNMTHELVRARTCQRETNGGLAMSRRVRRA